MKQNEQWHPDWLTASDYWEMLEDRTAGSFFWDRNEDFVSWSPKLLKVLGFDRQQASQYSHVEELIHPEDRVNHSAKLTSAIQSGSSYSVDIRLENSKAEYQLFRVEGFWVNSESSPGRYLIGFLMEISEVAQLRDQVDRSEHLFRSFFDHVPAAVYIKDGQRKHIYGNAFAAMIAGCDVTDFIGKTTAELFDEDTDKTLVDVDRRVLNDGETVVRHGEFETNSGALHYVYDTTFPLDDPITGERLIGGVGLDTTRQHQAELALAQAQKMEALGLLVGGIAHDFNNTLAILQGNVELMEVANTQHEVSECLREISRGVERGARLTKQLLAYARKSVLVPEPTDLNQVVKDTTAMLKRTLPRSIEISLRLETSLWNANVDRGQIESALLNLALNARDAMHQSGQIVISTKNHVVAAHRGEDAYDDTLEFGQYVRLSIQDNGSGMSAEIAERAFDPFFTTKDVGKGTGMGLPMVDGLMRQIGGATRLHSDPGQGTTIELFIPAKPKVGTEPDVPKEPNPNGSECVLLVEDDDEVRSVLMRQLTWLGYKVVDANDGDRALEILADNNSIQLLLTDIVMPGKIQGYDLANEARKLHPTLPVVFLSGYLGEDGNLFDSETSDGHKLMKPVSVTELSSTLRSALETSDR